MKLKFLPRPGEQEFHALMPESGRMVHVVEKDNPIYTDEPTGKFLLAHARHLFREWVAADDAPVEKRKMVRPVGKAANRKVRGGVSTRFRKKGEPLGEK